jgi:hypothetical protein
MGIFKLKNVFKIVVELCNDAIMELEAYVVAIGPDLVASLSIEPKVSEHFFFGQFVELFG